MVPQKIVIGDKMPETIVTVLCDDDIEAIDTLVNARIYDTRADLLKAAVRNFLWEEGPLDLERLSMISLTAEHDRAGEDSLEE